MVASLAMALGAALIAFWIFAFLLFNVACDACIWAARFCTSSTQLTATNTEIMLSRCITHLHDGEVLTWLTTCVVLFDYGRTSKNEFSGLLKSRRLRPENPAWVTISLATGSVKPSVPSPAAPGSAVAGAMQSSTEIAYSIPYMGSS